MKDKRSATNIQLAFYWEVLKKKIEVINSLEDLIVRRRRVIKTTATLTYKSDSGRLVLHRYNKKNYPG